MIKDLQKKRKSTAAKLLGDSGGGGGRRATMDAGDISTGARNRLASVADVSSDRASMMVLCVDIPGENYC